MSTSIADDGRPAPSLYTRLRDLLGAARQEISPGAGVVLTIDEVESGALEQLARVGSALQRLVREDRPLIVVAAGLPDRVSDLLEHRTMTFLRRAPRFDVGPLGWAHSKLALAEPFLAAGKSIDPIDLDRATKATQGYPFLIQVVGDTMWNFDPDNDRITRAAVDQAASQAVSRMASMVHEPEIESLSPRQVLYLQRMVAHDGPVSTSRIAGEMGVSDSNAGNIRAALRARGLVHDAGRGLVDFAMPYLREYMAIRHSQSAGPPLQPPGHFGPGLEEDAEILASTHPRSRDEQRRSDLPAATSDTFPLIDPDRGLGPAPK